MRALPKSVFPIHGADELVIDVLLSSQIYVPNVVFLSSWTANLNTLPCAKALGTRRRALLLGPA